LFLKNGKELSREKAWNKGKESVIRKKNVIEYTLNPYKWKEKIGYGKRWIAEIFFSSFKRIFGEHVKARKFENMVNELMIKACFIICLLVCKVKKKLRFS
jgi:hypothetical protein